MGRARKHKHAEARQRGDLGHGRSLPTSRQRQHLGGARKPHAVVSMSLIPGLIHLRERHSFLEGNRDEFLAHL